ncbi:programmed cell death protein 2 isoform X2 [Antennarius striatus]|uniref:programmed cell death protein 2 isoform X2 n=1 Tax=Antennarius striatus TaxID=241820 RepID=UPI0035B1052C
MSSPEVVLGFLEDAPPWRLRSPQFPSKVGGKPSWLSQRGLPSSPRLECDGCRLPMAFLLQIYAPISGQDRSFHRTLFLFCCRSPECYTNNSHCMKVFRSQLPRKNEFYSYDPPPDDEPPNDSGSNPNVLPVSGVKLCWVCGCPGNKACSRCHTVTYCGKNHQTLHWKHTHKKECCSQEASVVTTSPFLFSESELVTEPEEEEEDEKDTKEAEEEECVECPSFAESLAERDLEEIAMHETEDSKVFQRFKKKIAPEPHQVMPQLLNSLHVDSTGASIDWGTLVIYTCSASCNNDDLYSSEYIWKQDFSPDQHTQIKPT